GRIPGYLDRCVIGNRPNGIYVPRFRNVKTKSEFLRGYGFQGNARRLEWGDNIFTKGIGIDLKKQLSTLGPWTMSFYGYAECLPREENRVTLDPTRVDAWGIPALRIDAGWSSNERALHHDMSISASELLDAAGALDIKPATQPSVMGSANHEMGG